MLKKGMTKTHHDVGRRRLLKGGLGLVLNPLAAASGIATPMQMATNMLSAAPVTAAAAVLPHYLFRLLTPMHATRALQLYPWQLMTDRPGQGILSDIKRKPLSGDAADESFAEIKNTLQQALDVIAERQKETPLEARDYLGEVRRGLPQSIANHFGGRILDLLMVYGHSPEMLKSFTDHVKANEDNKKVFQNLYGGTLNHRTIRVRIMEHISMMMSLFDTADQMLPPKGDGPSLSALDAIVFDLLADGAQVSIRLKGDCLSAEEKKAALANVNAETEQLLARLSEHDKVMLLLEASLLLPTKMNMPENIQEGCIKRDYSHMRNKITNDLVWLRTLPAQSALSSLRQDVASFFAQREMQKKMDAKTSGPSISSSLSSLSNVTSNAVRSTVAGLASLFKQGADVFMEKKDTPEGVQQVPPLALPHQQPDILSPDLGAQIKQPVPRDKNAPGPQ